MHQLTLRPNTLISLIGNFTIFNGWIDSQVDPYADPGFLSGENTGSAHGTNIYVRTYARKHTNACTDRHMNVHAQADG